jgi:hypothetical protein
LAAPPPGNDAPATSARAQSAFGQAMAELTRSMRAAKPVGHEASAATGSAIDGNATDDASALATTDPDGR